MTTPRVDRFVICNHARLLIKRAAAKTVHPSGMTIPEVLASRLPEFITADKGDRGTMAAAIAKEIFPGADWMIGFLLLTYEYWTSPTCPETHRFKVLAGPESITDTPTLFSITPLIPTAEQMYRAEEELEELEFAAASGRILPPYVEGSTVPNLPSFRMPEHVFRSPRAPRPISERDAQLLSDYQYGRQCLSVLTKRDGRSKTAVWKSIHHAARVAGMTLREPNPAGRPVKG